MSLSEYEAQAYELLNWWVRNYVPGTWWTHEHVPEHLQPWLAYCVREGLMIDNVMVGITPYGKLVLEQQGKPAAKAESASTEPPPPRWAVDFARKTLTFDGKSFDVSSENALRWFKVLAEHRNEWISGTELEGFDDSLLGVRTDRVKAFLPEKIQTLIDSETGKGSRLRL